MKDEEILISKPKFVRTPKSLTTKITFPLLTRDIQEGGTMDHFRAAPVPAVPES